MATRSIAADQIQLVLRRLASLGVAPEQLCGQAGIDPARLEQPGAMIPEEWASRLLAAAERITGDALVGLHAAEAPGVHGFFDYLSMAQPTVEQGFEVLARFAALMAEGMFTEVRRTGAHAWIHLELPLEDPALRRHAYEYVAALMVRNYRACAGDASKVSEVRFPHGPHGPQAEYERVLGSAVRFHQSRFAFGLPTDALVAPHDYPNPTVVEVLTKEANQQLALAAAADLSTRVEQRLREDFERGAASAPEQLARALGVSARTLQRRLAEEGRTFRGLRDEVRRSLALELVRGSDARVSEIAEKLGFADPAAFDKAFRRWTGQTPRAFRRAPG